jgi:hypothetical protein
MGTTPITIARQRVKVIHKDIPELDWHKVSSRKVTHSVSKFRPTGLGKKIPLDGDSETDNITTEAGLRLPEMAGFLADLRAKKKFAGATVVVLQYDVDGVEIGKEEWFDCMVASVEFPEADANNDGGDVASVVVEWAVAD